MLDNLFWTEKWSARKHILAFIGTYIEQAVGNVLMFIEEKSCYTVCGDPACSKVGLFQWKVNLPAEIYSQTTITVCEIGTGEISGIVHSHYYRQEHGIK